MGGEDGGWGVEMCRLEQRLDLGIGEEIVRGMRRGVGRGMGRGGLGDEVEVVEGVPEGWR